MARLRGRSRAGGLVCRQLGGDRVREPFGVIATTRARRRRWTAATARSCAIPRRTTTAASASSYLRCLHPQGGAVAHGEGVDEELGAVAGGALRPLGGTVRCVGPQLARGFAKAEVLGPSRPALPRRTRGYGVRAVPGRSVLSMALYIVEHDRGRSSSMIVYRPLAIILSVRRWGPREGGRRPAIPRGREPVCGTLARP